MEIFKNFEPNGEFDKHYQMILDMRIQIQDSLIRMGFDVDEQNEALKVIDDAYISIREIAKGLVGSNINSNPKKATEKALKEIDKIIKNLPNEVKKKMNYIIKMKKDLGEY